MLHYTITEDDHCRPVGSWLRRLMPAATGGYLHQLLKKGHLTVNGAAASDLQPLLTGDTLALKESGRTRALLNARVRSPGVDILFEDSRIICINKPGGISMHPAAEAGDDTVTETVKVHLHARELAAHPHAAEPTFKLRPVNRLDRGTSGCVILAKSSTAAGIFGKLVMEGGLDKLYLALASGSLAGSGTITAPVEGKESLTRYHALCSSTDMTLIALWPETGRMHQIRQHLNHIGHPVVGDRRYGGPAAPAYPGFALHSFRTAFTHPETAVQTVIYAPLPPAFLALLRRIALASLCDILQQLPSLHS